MNRTIIITLSIVVLALAASVATVTYAANMQEHYRDEHESMSSEECEEEMAQMHGTGGHSSMMNNSHNGMMQGTETSDHGCPGH